MVAAAWSQHGLPWPHVAIPVCLCLGTKVPTKSHSSGFCMELGLALTSAGSDRAAHTPQPGSAQAQTHPHGMWHLISGLFHYQEHRPGQIQQLGNTVTAVWGTGSHGWARKGRGQNGTDASHQQKDPLSVRGSQKHSTL